MEMADPVVGQLQLPADMGNLNPLEDSSLNAFLEDLQEGTFLSLLQDDKLFCDLTECPLSPSKAALSPCDSGSPFQDLFGDHRDLVEFGMRELESTPGVTATVLSSDSGTSSGPGSPCERWKSPVKLGTVVKERSSSRQGTRGTSRKRPRAAHMKEPSSESDSDISSTDSEPIEALDSFVQPEKRSKWSEDSGHLAWCVQHDHSYMSGCGNAESGCVGQTSMEGDNEEGSGSDTGYETMSASTSPGSGGAAHTVSLSPVSSTPSTALPSSPPLHPASSLPSLPALPPVGPNADPVALIDARIKHFMCSRQVNLTEEEKETLRAEGLPIPTTLPLTKTEEKALKTVRRKIRNKMAAQESRRRKKEHVQTLEEKVRQYANENLRLKKKMEALEADNKSLATQLKKLHAMVTCTTPATTSGSGTRTTQVGACLMVLVLCFALFLGNYGPQRSSSASDYTTPTVRSRSLLSVENPQNFQKAACDLLSHIFLRDKDPHLSSDDAPPVEVLPPPLVAPEEAEDKWDIWEWVDEGDSGKLCPVGIQTGNDTCMSADA